MSGGVLTINGGSSSIKFAVFTPGDPPRSALTGKVERIGMSDPMLGTKGVPPRRIDAPDHEHAVGAVVEELEKCSAFRDVTAIGHRVVHGGPNNTEARLITTALVEELREISPLDPAHLPGEIALIEAFRRFFPDMPQVACFDTAFHRDIPRVAQLLPVPRRYEAEGVRRYGFHGLSYAYLMEVLAKLAGPKVTGGRVILAHLGAGASMAAVRAGKCVDTTMSFTPTAGLVMGTRSGDLDPGLLIYLMRRHNLALTRLTTWSTNIRGCSAFRTSVPTCVTSWPSRPTTRGLEMPWRSFVIKRRNGSAPIPRPWAAWMPSFSPAASVKTRRQCALAFAKAWTFSVSPSTVSVMPPMNP